MHLSFSVSSLKLMIVAIGKDVQVSFSMLLVFSINKEIDPHFKETPDFQLGVLNLLMYMICFKNIDLHV